MTFARVRALIVVVVLFVTASVVVIMAIGRDTQTHTSGRRESCPAGLVPAKNKMPERNQVTLNVYNGTPKVGLAQQIGGEFKNRGFNINKTDTAPNGKTYNQIALITFGPNTVGAAYLVSAYFLVNEAELQFEIERTSPEVDVIIGTAFQQLATTTEVNQSIAAIGNPPLPKGTCEAAGPNAPLASFAE
jgi:hypothetical protein